MDGIGWLEAQPVISDSWGAGGENILQHVCVGVCVASGFPLAQPATGEVEKQSFVLTREQEELRVVEGGRRDTPPPIHLN